MSHNRLQLIGLPELRAQLRNLQGSLAKEAGVIVQAHAADAQRQIIDAYPQVTGSLKRGVSLRTEQSRFGVSAEVKSRAHHSHLFERITEGPLRKTRTGASRGRMPAAPDSERMIPIVIQARRRMVAALIQLVERTGFQVTSS